jgi:hypothetical protein
MNLLTLILPCAFADSTTRSSEDFEDVHHGTSDFPSDCEQISEPEDDQDIEAGDTYTLLCQTLTKFCNNSF